MGISWQQLNIAGWHMGYRADVPFSQFCPLSDLVAHLAAAGRDLCQVLLEANKNDPLYADKNAHSLTKYFNSVYFLLVQG